jgi:hypothetical protein
MSDLQFTDEEGSLLATLIQNRLTKLVMEISHTDARAFRDALRHESEVLEAIARRLPAVAPQGAPTP